MPQMSPFNWFALLVLFSAMMLIVNSKIYSFGNFLISGPSSINLKSMTPLFNYLW